MSQEIAQVEIANKNIIDDINKLLTTMNRKQLNNILDFTKNLLKADITPLDIQGINTNITGSDIVEVLKETRERSIS